MIWLIGNKGMLGSDVEKLLKESNQEFIATDIEVDITDFETLKGYVGDRNVNWIINCAAYTAVDRAEDEPKKAYGINAEGPLNIAKIAQSKGAKLIHISTDYVFDGKKDGPYTEEDAPSPIGVYGKSKLEGENNIQSILENYFIIRTAWLYGKNGNNFVYTMLRLFNEQELVKVVADQWGSPTYSKDLAEVIRYIIGNDNDLYGIYHYTNEGRTTWYEFAKEIYEKARMNELVKQNLSIVPITTSDYPTKAVRPKNSSMSKEKVKSAFRIDVRDWKIALEEFIIEIKDKIMT
jgi:dTDP-4-dehydrorhamnose reductase